MFGHFGKTTLFIFLILLLMVYVKHDTYNDKLSHELSNLSYTATANGVERNSLVLVTDPNNYKNSTSSRVRDVSYVTKQWVENNPTIPCGQSTFLRAKERAECEMYKLQKDNYTWNVITTEFNGKYYIYDQKTKMAHSCPDGYFASYVFNKLTCEFEKVETILPRGCSSSVGYSSITGVSCDTYE